MRRGYMIMGSLIGACLLLASCGQPLIMQPTGSAAQGLGSAPPGVAPAGSISSDPGASAAGSVVVVVPEASEPAVEASLPAPDGAADGTSAPAAAESLPPAPEPTIDPAFNGVTLPGAAERWRYVQQDRTPLGGVQTYTTPGRQILWWYDPSLGRTIRLGEIQGDFPVQATFRFRGQEVDALEVPYQLNQSFGITVPNATVEQIQKAGYSGDWIEAFVYKTDDIRPK